MMFLLPSEVQELTGRERPAAQRRALKRMGIAFILDADDLPKVSRALVDALSGAPAGGMLPEREPELNL